MATLKLKRGPFNTTDMTNTRRKQVPKRGRYIEHNPEKKNMMFNRPMAKLARRYWQHMGESLVFTLDAAQARTSHALIAEGIPSDAIIAFTSDKADYEGIPLRGMMSKLHAHSSDVYMAVGASCRAAVVIHDSNRTAGNVLKEIEELLTGGCLERIALGINICSRDAGRGARDFDHRIRRMARKHGFAANIKRLAPYIQCKKGRSGGAPMAPFWITLEVRHRGRR